MTRSRKTVLLLLQVSTLILLALGLVRTVNCSPKLPTHIDKADALELRLFRQEVEMIQAQEQQLEASRQRAMAKFNEKLRRVISANKINEKTDDINLETFEIVRDVRKEEVAPPKATTKQPKAPPDAGVK